MISELITVDVWRHLGRAARRVKGPCSVAVAYFGKGASKLLPLPKGSTLVVDASEAAIAAGQTHPLDLAALVQKKVRVYSVRNLHAKVYVFGREAFIGSANASHRAAQTLIETVVRTREPATVKAAREFIAELCMHEMTPEMLAGLQKLYRPPRLAGGHHSTRQPSRKSSDQPGIPRLLLAQLVLATWTEDEEKQHKAARKVALTKRKNSAYVVSDFLWTKPCPFRLRDIVVQITDEGNGRVWVSPPGNVIHVDRRGRGGRQKSFVYLECPDRRRKAVRALARDIGQGALKRLRGGGLIRNALFARKLLRAWSAGAKRVS